VLLEIQSPTFTSYTIKMQYDSARRAVITDEMSSAEGQRVSHLLAANIMAATKDRHPTLEGDA